MWIFTVKGFFTFVTDRKDPNYLWLRARMREHIEDNFPGVKAEMKPGADYLWRAKVKRDDVALRIAELVLESRVDSHFKDVMIKTAAAPKRGSLSKVMYAVWNGAAEWQDYAPYSKVPRPVTPVVAPRWNGGQADRRPGTGQQAFGSALPSYTYGGTGSGRYASDFDWDARDWGGTQAADPVKPIVREDDVRFSDDYSEEEWAAMSEAEQQEILDEEEEFLRAIEAGQDYDAAARAARFQTAAPVVADVLPAPRNRPGSRKKARKGRRKNRHNQTPADQERYAQERRDGKHGQEARNRQGFLDKQAAQAAKVAEQDAKKNGGR